MSPSRRRVPTQLSVCSTSQYTDQTSQNLPGGAFGPDQCTDNCIGIEDGSEHTLPAPRFARAVFRFIGDLFRFRLGRFLFLAFENLQQVHSCRPPHLFEPFTGTTAARDLPYAR
jgi:hypothetical protein